MKFQKGFTLIELIVVMSVFLFIIGSAIVIFVSVIKNQKVILYGQENLNQTSYVLEHMSKALRMAKKDEGGGCINLGSNYQLTRSDTSGDSGDPNNGFYTGIKFINQSDSDACQEFYLDTTDGILKEEKNDFNDHNDENAVALTSSTLKIKSIRFAINGGTGCSNPADSKCISGASESDLSQPKITILLTVSGDSQNPEKTIQTTISQRNLNAK